MLTFISDYPYGERVKDGMAQRILAIDDLVSSRKRVYLEISYKSNFKREKYEPQSNCTVYRLNFFKDFFFIKGIIRKSRLVYFHSVYNSLKCLFHVKKQNSVLDVHGVVPEENLMKGKRLSSKLFGLAERLAIKKVNKVVVVSEMMQKHLEEKYTVSLKGRIITLPIFECQNKINVDKSQIDNVNMVYAGGNQVWQNIDLMMSSISSFINKNIIDNVAFTLYFPQNVLPEVKEKYSDVESNSNVIFSSATPSEIKDILQNSKLGFVLRDDNIVNNVACPTKLIEYMNNGVLPIVLSPRIGDFNMLGYRYVTLDSLLKDKSFLSSLDEDISYNFGIIESWKTKIDNEKEYLKSYLINVQNEMY